MARRPSSEEADVDLALNAWRRAATNILLAAMALAFLPTVAVNVAGHGQAITRLVRLYLAATYLFIVAAALLRGTDYRLRLKIVVCLAYGVALVACVAVPTSPARAFPVWLPVVILVLLGRSSGRAAALAGALVFLVAPLLRHIPIVVVALGGTPARGAGDLGATMVQAFTLMAMMATSIVVVEGAQEFLVRALGDQRRAAADLGREAEERRRLEREIAGVGDDDRRRLGQEVHDGVCQELTGALLRCQALDRRVQRGGAADHSDLATLTRLLEDALNDAHAVARGLWPLDPDPGALAQALRSLARRMAVQTGVRCESRSAGDVQVCRPEVAQHLYRIAQEALSNAARHAHASHITVDLVGCDDRLMLQVEDDGIGIPDDRAQPGMGLRTMSYRARIMEGELTVERLREGGTRVVCSVPRPSSDNDGGSGEPSGAAGGERGAN